MKKIFTTIILGILIKTSASAQCSCYTVGGLNIVGQDFMELIVSNSCDQNVYLNLYVISTLLPLDTLGRQELENAFFPPNNTPFSQILNTELTTAPAFGTYRVSITNGTLVCDSIQFSFPLSLTEVNHSKDNLFSPNPFSEQTILLFNAPMKNARLTIYSSNGQMVRQIENIYGEKVILNREHLLSGIYFVSLIEDNRLIISGKLMID
ncbi:MAG: T9SS type A sorting domain-containing protein [Crocinitomicaceae bacterium]|nr:T9SS type A sorting domain-containing protein [Crocinitomicaceae bacterium]